jgi:hypothetical protein
MNEGTHVPRQEDVQNNDAANPNSAGRVRAKWQKPVLLQLSVQGTEGSNPVFTDEDDFKNMS